MAGDDTAETVSTDPCKLGRFRVVDHARWLRAARLISGTLQEIATALNVKFATVGHYQTSRPPIRILGRDRSDVIKAAMLSFILSLVVLYLGWRASSRMSRLERELGSMSERLRQLEQRAGVTSPSVAPQPAAAPPAPAMNAPVVGPASVVVDTPRGDPSVVVTPGVQPAIVGPSTMTAPSDSIEARIGARWLLYVGVLAIIIGVAYFERLAAEQGWINDTARVIQGAVVGLALIEGGRRLARRGYELYGQVLAGGGVAVLYVSTYAAVWLAHLINLPTAFVLMFAETVLGAWLADRHRSQWLALFAIGGGFLTPFLLANGSGAQLPLFGYIAILDAGTMFLAQRRAWPRLNLASYLLTLLTTGVWALDYYRSTLYLQTLLFLLCYSAMFVVILWRRSADAPRGFSVERAVLWTAPVVFHAASFVVLFDHNTAFVIYTIAMTALAVAAGPRIGAYGRFAAWFFTALPLAAWSLAHGGRAPLTEGLIAWAAVYALHLAGVLRAYDEAGERPIASGDIAVVHGNGVVTFLGVYALLGISSEATGAWVALTLAAVHLALAFAIRRGREFSLHFVALAATLLAFALSLRFDAPWAVLGWTIEGAGLAWLGLRQERWWLRAFGLALLAIACSWLFSLQSMSVGDGYVVMLSARSLASLVMVVALGALATIYRRSTAALRDRELHVTVLTVAACLVGLTWLSSEIHAFWRLRDMHQLVEIGTSRVAREMTLSIGWAAYALLLIGWGLKRHSAPLRYFAMLLFGVTIIKVFAVDLASLDRIYRVLSIIGLGIALLVTSYLYQRSKAGGPPRPA